MYFAGSFPYRNPLRFHETWRASHLQASAVSLNGAFGLNTVSFRTPFSFITLSAYGTLHFIAPSTVKQRLTAK